MKWVLAIAPNGKAEKREGSVRMQDTGPFVHSLPQRGRNNRFYFKCSTALSKLLLHGRAIR